MLGAVVIGVLGIAALYAAADVADNVVGQPRKNGIYDKNRTTKIEDGLRIAGVAAVTVLVIDLLFNGGELAQYLLSAL